MIVRPSEEALAKIAASSPGDELIWQSSNTWGTGTAYERVTVVRKTKTRVMVKSSQYNELAFHLKNGHCVGSDRYTDHIHWPEGEILGLEKEYRKGVLLAKMRDRIAGEIYKLEYGEVLEVFEFVKLLKAERRKVKEEGERKKEGPVDGDVQIQHPDGEAQSVVAE